MKKKSNVIFEAEREIPILYKTDVLVVGGGPAGIGAALAAGRHGANVILLERYGYLGGLATGGLVVLFDAMRNNKEELIVRGIAQEIVEELEKLEDGVIYPSKSSGKMINPTVHPEYLKIISVRMLEEAGVKIVLHSYACSTIVNNGKVKGIIFESKMGRMAIQSKVTIDCTGDGDVFARAGADFFQKDLPTGLVFRIGGVDTKKSDSFIMENSEKYRKLLNELHKKNKLEGAIAAEASGGKARAAGAGTYSKTTINSVVWFSNSFSKGDSLDIEHLTCAEKTIREKALSTLDFYKKHIPGFENSFLLDTASQFGTRANRRLLGEHVLTQEEIKNNIKFKDIIATCIIKSDSSLINIPYGCLLPKKIDNLLVAGRSISTDFITLITLRLIPPCLLTGQAAGVAASMAVEKGLSPREINREKLRSILTEDDVYLAY